MRIADKARSVNLILYCRKWHETVTFYKDVLGFEVLFQTNWFVEFGINDRVRLSVADEEKASVKSSHGKGVTFSIEVTENDEQGSSLEDLRDYLIRRGVNASPLRVHPWNATVFYVWDPEGYRIEFWTRKRGA